MHTDSNLRRGLVQTHSGAHTSALRQIGSPKLRGSFLNYGKMEASAYPTPSFTTSYKKVAQFRESLLPITASTSHCDDTRGIRRHYSVCKGRLTPTVILFIQGQVYIQYIDPHHKSVTAST